MTVEPAHVLSLRQLKSSVNSSPGEAIRNCSPRGTSDAARDTAHGRLDQLHATDVSRWNWLWFGPLAAGALVIVESHTVPYGFSVLKLAAI